MNRINLEENRNNGLSYKEIIEKFFIQIYDTDIYKESKMSEQMKKDTVKRLIQSKQDSVKVTERFVDPRLRTLKVYAVCSQKEIDKLILFESDYVSYKKEIKKISKLKRHKTMKFEVYNISYNEKAFQMPFVTFIIIKDDAGALCVRDIIINEDDMYYLRQRLDSCDAIF